MNATNTAPHGKTCPSRVRPWHPRFVFPIAFLATSLLMSLAVGTGCRFGGRPLGEPDIGGPRPLPLPTPVKAVWVARFHYHFPDDIRAIMRSCAQAGFNTVLWQVRGEGTVAYRSRIEPWSAEYGHRDPGFDPLAIAVAEAHKHGLRIEAWINAMPGWKGPKTPPIADQLWHTRPEWFLRDAAGQRQPLGNFYAILNPCLPEVRAYIADIVAELTRNYDLDGVHLDYIRYAWDTTPNARQLYPRDPATLRLYRQETGKHPDDDPQAWDHWRANQLTLLVGQIRDRLQLCRPGATLTAAVWSTPQVGYRSYFQNAVAWLRTGIVDAVMPMAYTDRLDQFEGYIGAYKTLVGRERVVPGLGVYKHETPEQMGRQLDRCRAWGGDFALFSYESLHASAGDRGGDGRARIDPGKQRLRQMRTGVLRRFAGR